MPVQVTGDGNCLFNSMSVALVGNESMSVELRVRTCIELNENCDAYEQCPEHHELRFVSPSVATACKQTAIDGQWSSAWVIKTASSVVAIPIQSVYPAKNGPFDKTVGILNTITYPLGKRASRLEPVIIAWTRCNTVTSGFISRPRET